MNENRIDMLFFGIDPGRASHVHAVLNLFSSGIMFFLKKIAILADRFFHSNYQPG